MRKQLSSIPDSKPLPKILTWSWSATDDREIFVRRSLWQTAIIEYLCESCLNQETRGLVTGCWGSNKFRSSKFIFKTFFCEIYSFESVSSEKCIYLAWTFYDTALLLTGESILFANLSPWLVLEFELERVSNFETAFNAILMVWVIIYKLT